MTRRAINRGKTGSWYSFACYSAGRICHVGTDPAVLEPLCFELLFLVDDRWQRPRGEQGQETMRLGFEWLNLVHLPNQHRCLFRRRGCYVSHGSLFEPVAGAVDWSVAPPTL